MGCEICGRLSCTRSFHSIEAQEAFDERNEMSADVDELRCEIQDLKAEKTDIRRETIAECKRVFTRLYEGSPIVRIQIERAMDAIAEEE